MVLSKTCTFLYTHCTSQNKYEYKLTNLYIFFNFLILLILLPLFSYPYPKIHIENFLKMLNQNFTYVIIRIGKRKLVHLKHKSNPHKLPLVGVLVLFFWMAKPNHQACYRLILTVKPFAYVVGNYTCHNRKDKRS